MNVVSRALVPSKLGAVRQLLQRTMPTPKSQTYASITNSFAALETEDAKELEQAASASVQQRPSSGSQAASNGKTRSESGKVLDPLVWIDLEMTGLDVENDTIIEIACIVTDGRLKEIIEGPAFAIHTSDEVLDGMNEWCKEHHGKSGLTQRVRESKIGMKEAEERVLAFVQQYVDVNTAQLAGNSVHVDRMFLVKNMPDFINHLNYRIVDVSSVKELARRWFPQEYKRAPRKVCAHTALSDIRESIQELKYYRKAVFKPIKAHH